MPYIEESETILVAGRYTIHFIKLVHLTYACYIKESRTILAEESLYYRILSLYVIYHVCRFKDFFFLVLRATEQYLPFSFFFLSLSFSVCPFFIRLLCPFMFSYASIMLHIVLSIVI